MGGARHVKVRLPIRTGRALFTTLYRMYHSYCKTKISKKGNRVINTFLSFLYLDFLLPRQCRSIAIGGSATNQPTNVAFPSGLSSPLAWIIKESKYSLVSRWTIMIQSYLNSKCLQHTLVLPVPTILVEIHFQSVRWVPVSRLLWRIKKGHVRINLQKVKPFSYISWCFSHMNITIKSPPPGYCQFSLT